MDNYTVIIIATLVGFVALAAALLIPVYFFIQREKKAAKSWTKEALAQPTQQEPRRNGADGDAALRGAA